jgi:hypothetical protein
MVVGSPKVPPLATIRVAFFSSSSRALFASIHMRTPQPSCREGPKEGETNPSGY